MRSLRPLPVVPRRRGRLPRRRLALALALALLAAAPGPGAPAWSPEEVGLRAADNEYRAPGGGRVRLARWQPAAGPGGFMGRIAHDMDRDSKTGHAGREAVPCWLGDNSFMLLALALPPYAGGPAARTFAPALVDSILAGDVRGKRKGEFQDGRQLHVGKGGKLKVEYWDKACGPSTDAKPLVGVTTYAAEAPGALGPRQRAGVSALLRSQHKAFRKRKRPITCESGPEQGVMQHDYRRGSSLCLHLLNVLEWARVEKGFTRLAQDAFTDALSARTKKGLFGFPNGNAEEALGQTVCLYALARAGELFKGPRQRRARKAHRELQQRIPRLPDYKKLDDTQVAGWYLLGYRGEAEPKTAVEALLRNVVCTAGGGFTFAGTYKHQKMSPPLGAGPVEDMALGLAGLGVVRERGGYDRFRRACEGRVGADMREKRELLAEGAP